MFRILVLALSLSLAGCFAAKDVQSDSKPIDHTLFDTLLKRHVTEAGWVNYEGFIQDSAQLNQYLDLLSNNHPNRKNWSKDERLAYWINAYNAYTVKLVTDHYPVQSIKDIKSGIGFINSVWDIKFIRIEGQEYDLNNIEHNIIRPKFKEPRIHFAVNCASYSCPVLRAEAYTPDRLDEQLDEQARRFINDPLRNRVRAENAELSKIFSWYGGDFKKGGRSVIDYVNQYAETPANKGTDPDFIDYLWSLNSVQLQQK